MKNKTQGDKNLTEQEKINIKQRKQAIIDLVMRQTNYTMEEAQEKLEKYKYNYLQVIKFYMNPDSSIKKEEADVNKSKNQMIYGEIRNFMDDVNKQYLYRKRQKELLEKKKELFMRKLKEEQDRRVLEEKNKIKDNIDEHNKTN